MSAAGVSAAKFAPVPSKDSLSKERVRFQAPRSDIKRGEAPITDPITDPKGQTVYYDKASAGTFVFYDMMEMYMDNFPATLVWGDDNTVYFKNLLSVFPSEYYIKGTVDGNVITVPTDQTIEYFDEEGYGINFGVLKTVPGFENGEEVYFFEYAPEIKEIQFVIGNDGRLTMQLPGAPFDGENPTEYVAGLYYTDDYSFTGYCDFYQDYKRMEIEFITIPEGLEILPYVYVDEFNYAQIVEVAFSPDYLYIRGLNSMLPEGTIKAKIEGNKATVAQNEYLGIYFDQYYIMTKVLYENPDYDPDDESVPPFILAPGDVGFELTVDDTNNRIYADTEGIYLSFHAEENDFLSSLGYYGIFELKYQDTFTGTPSNPVSLEYTTDFAPYQGFNDFFFTLSNYSTDGKLLDVDYLYYKVLIDGKPLVFNQEEIYDLNNQKTIAYVGVPYEVELIPYLFDNNNDIFKYSDNIFDVGIYFDDFTTIGVQTVYYYDNTFTYSDIVTLNILTNETVVTPWESGVDTVVSDEIVSTEYYTLDGRKVLNPDRGLYIRVMKDASGRKHTDKIIR